MFGYLDESGTPGVATSAQDYLLVSLVIFTNDDHRSHFLDKYALAQKSAHKPSDFEFHFAHNTTITRDHFIRHFLSCDFSYITIAIRKTGSRNFASYAHIARLLISEIIELGYTEIRIDIDTNPTLYKCLRAEIKTQKIAIKLRQLKSHTCPMLQLADYVAALSAKYIKNQIKYLTAYQKLSKKCLVTIIKESPTPKL